MSYRILAAGAWAAIFGAAMSTALAAEPAEADRSHLWKLITLKCVRHLSKAEAPIPCDSIDVSKGWDHGVALLKASVGRGRMLAVATHAVTGIEDPGLLSPAEPDYFAVAWGARSNVIFHLGRNLARRRLRSRSIQNPRASRISFISSSTASTRTSPPRSRTMSPRSTINGGECPSR